MSKKTPDYGLDAPGIVRNCLVFGGLGLCAGGLLAWREHHVMMWLGVAILIASTVPFSQGLLMIHYSKAGKFRCRDRILDLIEWKGQETVLDVGTGRGLLLIGAAKRTSGRVVGIDLWSQKDLSKNSAESTMANAAIEGVADRVEVRDQDAQHMIFADCSFDAVFSNLCLHNIPTRDGRQQACREIARVLGPQGSAVISDYKALEDYEGAFAAAGCHVEPPYRINFFPPLRVVRVQKPSSQCYALDGGDHPLPACPIGARRLL
jgi:SAM-dependent methyltransferase